MPEWPLRTHRTARSPGAQSAAPSPLKSELVRQGRGTYALPEADRNEHTGPREIGQKRAFPRKRLVKLCTRHLHRKRYGCDCRGPSDLGRRSVHGNGGRLLRVERRETLARSGGGGHLGGQDVVRVAVKVLAGRVMTQRGAGIGVGAAIRTSRGLALASSMVVTEAWRSMRGNALVTGLLRVGPSGCPWLRMTFVCVIGARAGAM